jgi:hypothetical protein
MLLSREVIKFEENDEIRVLGREEESSSGSEDGEEKDILGSTSIEELLDSLLLLFT